MSKKWENAMRIEKMEHKILNSDMRWSDIINALEKLYKNEATRTSTKEDA